MEHVDLLPVLGNWSRGKGPLYQRLAGSLRDAIRRGDVSGPGRLPSERQLARSLHVSRTTVIAAYGVLRDEGLLESTRGSGTRVIVPAGWMGIAGTGTGLPSLKFLAESPSGVVDCAGSVIPDFGGLKDELLGVTAADLKALARDFSYEPMGLRGLRAAIAESYTRSGLDTSTEEILVTTGAQQAIQILFVLFGQDQGVILVEDPTYVGALDVARSIGARVVGVPTDDEGVQVPALHQALARSRASLAYLMPGCQNPTGAVMSSARRREVTTALSEAGVSVIDDRTLADLVLDGASTSPLAAFGDGTIITVGSLSKVFWPGLRVGWIRAPAPLIGRLARLKLVADLGSAHVSQLVATRVMPRIHEIGAVRREQLKLRLDLLAQLLDEKIPTWSFSRPRGGSFLWVRLPHGDAELFAGVALRYGVRILPGTRMSPSDAFGDRLRISFIAKPEELREAVDRLEQAWEAFASSAAADRVPVEVVV